MMRADTLLNDTIEDSLRSLAAAREDPECRKLAFRARVREVTLMPVTWASLEDIAAYEGEALGALVERIEASAGELALEDAAQIFAIAYFRLHAERRARNPHC